jgi:hypothetical protein
VRQGEPPGANWNAYSNTKVIGVKIYDTVRTCGKLWKTLADGLVASRPRPALATAATGSGDLRQGLTPEGPSRLTVKVSHSACSACDGDYEDPERTAWREPEEERRARAQAELEGGSEAQAPRIEGVEGGEQCDD